MSSPSPDSVVFVSASKLSFCNSIFCSLFLSRMLSLSRMDSMKLCFSILFMNWSIGLFITDEKYSPSFLLKVDWLSDVEVTHYFSPLCISLYFQNSNVVVEILCGTKLVSLHESLVRLAAKKTESKLIIWQLLIARKYGCIGISHTRSITGSTSE